MTLVVVSVILVRLGRPSRYTMVPMVFVTTMAFLAAVYQLWALCDAGNYMRVLLDVLIIVAAIWVMLEAASALMRARRVNAAPVATVVD